MPSAELDLHHEFLATATELQTPIHPASWPEDLGIAIKAVPQTDLGSSSRAAAWRYVTERRL